MTSLVTGFACGSGQFLPALLLSLQITSCVQLGEAPPAPRRRLRTLPAADPGRGSRPAVRGAAALQRCPHPAAVREKRGRQLPGTPGSRTEPLPGLQPRPGAAAEGGAPQTWSPAARAAPGAGSLEVRGFLGGWGKLRPRDSADGDRARALGGARRCAARAGRVGGSAGRPGQGCRGPVNATRANLLPGGIPVRIKCLFLQLLFQRHIIVF